jgi:hypothetical protein
VAAPYKWLEPYSSRAQELPTEISAHVMSKCLNLRVEQYCILSGDGTVDHGGFKFIAYVSSLDYPLAYLEYLK